MVLVKISCSQRIRFRRLVRMTRAAWNQLKATDEATMEREQRSPLSGWLDMQDVDSAGDFDDIEIDVVDEEGRQVEPAEYWDPTE